jgi:hypothetical protein
MGQQQSATTYVPEIVSSGDVRFEKLKKRARPRDGGDGETEEDEAPRRQREFRESLPAQLREELLEQEQELKEETLSAAATRYGSMAVPFNPRKSQKLTRAMMDLQAELNEMTRRERMSTMKALASDDASKLARTVSPALTETIFRLRNKATMATDLTRARMLRSKLYIDKFVTVALRRFATTLLSYIPCGVDVTQVKERYERDMDVFKQDNELLTTLTRPGEEVTRIIEGSTLTDLYKYAVRTIPLLDDCYPEIVLKPGELVLDEAYVCPVVGVLVVNLHGGADTVTEQVPPSLEMPPLVELDTIQLPDDLALSRISAVETTFNYHFGPSMQLLGNEIQNILNEDDLDPLTIAARLEEKVIEQQDYKRAAKIPLYFEKEFPVPEQHQFMEKFGRKEMLEMAIIKPRLQTKHYLPNEMVWDKQYSATNELGSVEKWASVMLYCSGKAPRDMLPVLMRNSRRGPKIHLADMIVTLSIHPGLAHLIVVDTSCQQLDVHEDLARHAGTHALLGGGPLLDLKGSARCGGGCTKTF